MSPAQALRLVTVNEEQLRQVRAGNAAIVRAIKEQQDKIINADPFDAVTIP